jgi:hypothetical protein
VKLEKHVDKRTLAAGLPISPRPEVIPEKIVNNRAFDGRKACDTIVQTSQGGKEMKKTDVYRNTAASDYPKFDKSNRRGGTHPG